MPGSQCLGKERIMYDDPIGTNAESIGQKIINLRRQMGPGEGVRFNAQIQVKQRKLIEINKQAVVLSGFRD
jgi:hypothetical protein